MVFLVRTFATFIPNPKIYLPILPRKIWWKNIRSHPTLQSHPSINPYKKVDRMSGLEVFQVMNKTTTKKDQNFFCFYQSSRCQFSFIPLSNWGERQGVLIFSNIMVQFLTISSALVCIDKLLLSASVNIFSAVDQFWLYHLDTHFFRYLPSDPVFLQVHCRFTWNCWDQNSNALPQLVQRKE